MVTLGCQVGCGVLKYLVQHDWRLTFKSVDCKEVVLPSMCVPPHSIPLEGLPLFKQAEKERMYSFCLFSGWDIDLFLLSNLDSDSDCI